MISLNNKIMVLALLSCCLSLANSSITPETQMKISPQFTDEQKENLLLYSAECMEKEKVGRAEIEALKHGDFGEATKNMKCFTKCFMEKLGILSSSGEVREEVLKTLFSDPSTSEELKTLLNKCHDLKDDNKCELAFKIYVCYNHMLHLYKF